MISFTFVVGLVAGICSMAAVSAAQTAEAASTVAKPREPFRIATAKSAITLCVGDDGRLYQLGYGAIGTTPAVPKDLPATGGDRAGDRLAECYPSFGNGYLNEPALQATHADGNTSTDLVYVSHSTRADDANGTTTRIEMKDPKYALRVTLFFATYRDQDVIRQWSEIHNDEAGAVPLDRFASSSPIFRAKEYWLTQLSGWHMREAALTEERLTPGVKLLDSKLGVRAHQGRTPGFVLSLNGPAKEESGEAILGSLEWAGNFAFAFDVDQNNGLRVVSGINPFASRYTLKPGETFATPAMIWTWTDAGVGQASRNLHRWARKHGLRDGDKPRPVLLNNWEATYFKFDQVKLVSLLDGAREIGADIFLLDDGWFGAKYPRDDDRTSLGDWTVDKRKLPDGLPYLVEQARQRGLGFGIWLEPEMVSPKSELFEAHPDWALGQAGREQILGRNQRVLDLTRPAVKDFVSGVIDGTLNSAPGTRYVKWDSNAYALQPGSTYLPAGEQSHVMIDYQRALYDVMDKAVAAHPDVMMMLCSSGPARCDYASLRRFTTFWTSDNTDPLRRVFIQWGFSQLYPAQAMSAHVTDMGKRPLKFAVDVALSGAFGLDLDLSKHSAEDRELLAAAVKLYKERLQPIVATGDLYRLESPYAGPRSAIDFVSEDKSRAVVFVYQHADGEVKSVTPRGLDPAKRYRVSEVNLVGRVKSSLAQQGQTIDGATLMRDGLDVRCAKQCDSSVIELIVE